MGGETWWTVLDTNLRNIGWPRQWKVPNVRELALCTSVRNNNEFADTCAGIWDLDCWKKLPNYPPFSRFQTSQVSATPSGQFCIESFNLLNTYPNKLCRCWSLPLPPTIKKWWCEKFIVSFIPGPGAWLSQYGGHNNALTFSIQMCKYLIVAGIWQIWAGKTSSHLIFGSKENL